ncbi:uncharacterized protein TNIN_174871 [Trichonephila inaurata madagascariensis]|uniref:Uncharacterized protein n=1 Tax=Trichonephila inaurata madagascariensis TaxID=2747483 RepID=A0A8X7C928_9ARAC|nr:uncharacterized protein TNIN_174871 [Trichonephila inaurata madagascariensis]
MGNSKNTSFKSLQYVNEESKIASIRTDTKSNNVHQVFLQQSVTLLALKDKALVNGTVAPNIVPPKLIFGIVAEDLPLLFGAVIGASLILALSVLILAFWKCCCRMTILNKKKQYWLQPQESTNIKGKYKIPVVQSNSVVFLGLKSTQGFDYKRERSSEDCIITKFVSTNEAFETSFGNPLHYTMSSQCPEIAIPGSEKLVSETAEENPNHASSDNLINQSCSVISVSPALNNRTDSCAQSSIFSPSIDIPDVTIHRDSPALFHRSFYSGSFDQRSLYSCKSHLGSEFDLKKCNFTWSNYSLRPSSASDCYIDLFQKANFCKKRKNRMRSDIAAAIALNRSQSPQLNKDTELLVENAVEVILDERTTL